MASERNTITSVMDETRRYNPPREFVDKAHIRSQSQYQVMHQRSIEDPEGFWGEYASELHWFKKWDRVLEGDLTQGDIKWFVGGRLNASYDCLDRHLETWRRNKAAIIWEGEPPGDCRTYTYQQLHREVCRFANVLRKKGITRGDRVAVYLPMIPELPIAMLACCRIGAIHSVVFAGFSAEALGDRIRDCDAKLLITSDVSFRGGKTIGVKRNADLCLERCPTVRHVIVVNRGKTDPPMETGRDTWWDEEMAEEDIHSDCEPEKMNAEDPLFILYTSGSTGKPKGVVHSTGGYLVYAKKTFEWVFDYRDEDTFWCTADIGWVTGHSYTVYGPLAAGATSLMFEGVPNYPKPDRFWEVAEKHRVSIFYTAPTAIRAIMREGEAWVRKHDLSSVRLLGTVGEPINPEAWIWYHDVVGRGRCPIVDTWWQTETGGILISPLPGAIFLKPGSATVPFFGADPAVVRDDGLECGVNEGGYLVIRKPWPGMLLTVFGDPERFKNTYLAQYPGMYFTGDGARKDGDGYFWLMGRVDDVINVSGHRMGTAEIESALVAHPDVAEAAVVGFPHEVKGQGIYAFVTLGSGVEKVESLKKELVAHVRREIGPIATPDKIHFADALPKTRSGKIMRRILKRIAAGDIHDMGDTSTLADPVVVEDLVRERQ